jgi:hypothetical protein
MAACFRWRPALASRGVGFCSCSQDPSWLTSSSTLDKRYENGEKAWNSASKSPGIWVCHQQDDQVSLYLSNLWQMKTVALLTSCTFWHIIHLSTHSSCCTWLLSPWGPSQKLFLDPYSSPMLVHDTYIWTDFMMQIRACFRYIVYCSAMNPALQ